MIRSSFLCIALSAVLMAACSKPIETPVQSPSSKPHTAARQALEPAQVVFSMRGSEADYRKCFMRAFGERGVVQARFDVDEGGSVQNVSIARSTVGRADVPQCIEERLRDQHFGQPNVPSEGQWTFVFRLTDPIDEDERQRLLEEDAELSDNEREDDVRILSESPGRLGREDIEDVVQVSYPLFARCYRDSITRRGESRGILRLRLDIDEGGHVTDVDDAGSVLPDPYAVDCMAEAFYAMKFPEPTGGPTRVEYRLDMD